jgi:mannose/fructose/N-acetylgalactosamine-specific phosphotransferase system component IIC
VTAGAELWRAGGAALLLGGLSLDQVAVGQCMISQPLVGGPILGWALGDPAAGLLAGAYFQFLCLTELRVGGDIPPDGVLAGLIGSAVFLCLPHPAGWSHLGVLGLLTVLFLPLAHLARYLEIRVCTANRLWVTLAERLVAAERFRAAQAAAVGGLAFFFLRALLLGGAVLVAAAGWGGAGLARAAGMNGAFEVFARVVPLLGLAAVVAQRRRSGWQTAVAAGLGAGVLFAGALA